MHANIPTTYRGIRMRSRLEAKWACVFDQLGWSWEYEPIDLNGWIPDIERALGKSEDYHAMILGAGLLTSEYDDCFVGWIRDDFCGPGNWENAVIIQPTFKSGVFGLASGCTGSYADRITGMQDGDRYYSPLTFDFLARIWAKATNTSQWKAPR